MQAFANRVPKLYQLIILIHLFLTVVVNSKYKGSIGYLFFFSTAFCILFSLTIRARNRPSAFFFGIMIWLGFWLKFICHHIVYYPYIDYFGNFRGFPDEWDLVLLIAGVGALGFSLALLNPNIVRSDFLSSPSKIKSNTVDPQQSQVRSLGGKAWFAFGALTFSIFLVAFLNVYWGVTLSGIAAQVSLPFKLNAISGWALYLGFSILVSYFAKYEYAQTGKLKYVYFLIFWESLLSSFSIFSRGLFVLHGLPLLYIAFVYYTERKEKLKKAIVLGTVFCGLFIINSIAVNAVRASLYEKNILKTQAYSPSIILNGETYSNAAPAQTFSQIGRLVVDRWIGLEGVMSVSTYSEKDYSLLVKTFFNKLKIGELDVYAKMSQYEYNPASAYNFMCLPGIVAFLYYSNSLLFVFIMMALIGLLLVGADYLVHRFFLNPLLSSLVGFYLANSMAQFGVSPRPLFISFFMTFSALFFLYWIEQYLKKRALRVENFINYTSEIKQLQNFRT